MERFRLDAKHQFAVAEDLDAPHGDYEGVVVTFYDENGGWLYTCNVGVPRSVMSALKIQGRWSNAVRDDMLRRRVLQIMADSQTKPGGPQPDLRIDDVGIFLARD